MVENLHNLKNIKAWGTIINDYNISLLTKKNKNLEVIDFGYCHNISAKGFISIGKNLHNLKRLHLTYCDGIDNKSIKLIVSNNKYLEDLLF